MKDQIWKTKMAAITVGIKHSISLVKGITDCFESGGLSRL
jgi:hypothetical protein